MLIEITFVTRGMGHRSHSITKEFRSYAHVINFKRKWKYSDWYIRIDGNKPTAEQMEILSKS